ncbi:MAG: AbrB/MazE/SpoVT family DNA-binding domain-containing protein [Thermoplasmatota archaeon]
MSLVAVKGKLLRWGNSFGLRLSRDDVQRLHLRPGAEVELKLEVSPSPDAQARVRTYRMGGKAADEHDQVFSAAAAREEGAKR